MAPVELRLEQFNLSPRETPEVLAVVVGTGELIDHVPELPVGEFVRVGEGVHGLARPIDVAAVADGQQAHEARGVVELVDDPIRAAPGRISALVVEHQRLTEPPGVPSDRVERFNHGRRNGERKPVELAPRRWHHNYPPWLLAH